MGISQTNRSAKAYTVETSPGVAGTLWRQLGVNGFGDYGPEPTEVVREPISPNNQREAGSIVDLQSKDVLEADAIGDHLNEFLPSSMLTRWTGPAEVVPTSATAAHFVVPAMASALPEWTLVYVRGAGIAANNGLKVVDALSTTTNIIIKGGLSAEAFTAAQGVTIEVCGFRFTAGDLQVNAGGNLITTTKDLTQLGLVAGQYVFVGGDAAAQTFAVAANRGYARITVAPTANLLTLDKKSTTFSIDNGAGKSIDLFFGRFCKVVPKTAADYLETTYQCEVTYDKLGAGDIPAYEYTKGNGVAEFVWTIPKTDKSTISVSFLGTDTEDPTTVRKTGADAPVRQNRTAMINTTTNVVRAFVRKADNTALTGYLTSLNLSIKTNATRNTAIANLGSILTTYGIVTVDMSATAFFTEPLLPSYIRQKLPITADVIVRNGDGAYALDIPEGRLGGGKRNLPVNEVVTIDLGVPANRDPIYNTSLMVSRFAYAPAA